MTESPNKSARYVQVRDLLEQAARFHGDLAGFYHRLAGEAGQQRVKLPVLVTDLNMKDENRNGLLHHLFQNFSQNMELSVEMC